MSAAGVSLLLAAVALLASFILLSPAVAKEVKPFGISNAEWW